MPCRAETICEHRDERGYAIGKRMQSSLLNNLKRSLRLPRSYLKLLSATSYSQYGEDALLFSAVQPSKHGFYVDVGAYDPIEGSNTYRLYRKGWKGLTIEPNPGAAWRFKALRGRDNHLIMGVSEKPSEFRYFEFDIAMLNTTDEKRAKELEKAGHPIRMVRVIKCDSLATILDAHAHGVHVDVLNVDCEGHDLSALKSLDFKRHRPTVVIVEDLQAYFGMRGGGGDSEIKRFMRERQYEPVAQLLYSVVFVALDWKVLNKRSGAFREAAIHPNLLPEMRGSVSVEAPAA